MEAPNFMKKVKPYKTVQNRTWQFKSSLPYPYENRTKPYISVHGLNCPEILLWLQKSGFRFERKYWALIG